MTTQSFTRRLLLKLLPANLLSIFAISNWRTKQDPITEPTRFAQEGDNLGPAGLLGGPHMRLWQNTNDRVWLGEEFWANPMEDWRVIDGAAECLSKRGGRNVHTLAHQITDPSQRFGTTVYVKKAEAGELTSTGFRIGIKSEINEYRSNCFANNGINAGIMDGSIILGKASKRLKDFDDNEQFFLMLRGTPAGDKYSLELKLFQVPLDENGHFAGRVLVDTVSTTVNKNTVLGNVAVASSFQPATKKNPRNANRRGKTNSRFRFSRWKIDGLSDAPENKFGPILWSMYSLSDSRSEEEFVMKISALTAPLGEEDNQDVELQIQKDGKWKSLGKAPLDTDAWVATFRIPNWDEKTETPYRLLYEEKFRNGSKYVAQWTGKIKANPVGRPLRVGALTCQKDYGFPYAPVANNIIKLDPDMLYFSGDQIYEGHGGFGFTRDPADIATLCYLRKYYMFGMAFRHAMKDRPTLVLPDDHDVFQGNIWGEGGAPMEDKAAGASSKGGYREPARMVNAVHKTCVAHHPDAHDPSPSQQDISVYYGDMVYGNVSFAVLGDRQWKSGPERVDTGGKRADHVADKDFDCSKLDLPGLVLLGERQEKFLDQWGDDWRGHEMKVLLSQTVFAGVATHHGKFDGYLKGDLDSGGWPQTPRDNAINILRKSMALHICGDQHLATLSQYGVDAQRDSNWCFCTPAISAGYPRWWRPDDIGLAHENRPKHGLANTGEFVEGFGNKVYVYAVGNPEVGTKKNRYELAHQKGSGFGLVTIDTAAKTYHLDSFRFSVDATDGKPENQHAGWPVTIQQKENKGENVIE